MRQNDVPIPLGNYKTMQMKILAPILFVLLFAISGLSQTLPDISNFRSIGTTEAGPFTIAFYVNPKSVKRDGEYVLFDGMLSPLLGTDDDKWIADPDNWIISGIYASCTTKAYSFRESYGMTDGKPFKKPRDPNTNIAEKGTPIFRAIEYACSPMKEASIGQDAR